MTHISVSVKPGDLTPVEGHPGHFEAGLAPASWLHLLFTKETAQQWSEVLSEAAKNAPETL